MDGRGGGPGGLYRRAGREGDLPASVDRALLKRVWSFARPYRARLAIFLAAITGSALVAVVPPLLFRRIIDEAIPAGDRGW